MSMTLDQIFIANPITSNAATDLMYFAQSPYTAGKDAGMTYANFSAQFVGNTVLTTKGDLLSYSTTPTRLAVGTTNGQVLQVNSAAATGLSYSTATYPVTTTINQILFSSAANVVGGISTANSATMFTTTAGVPGFTGSMTNGQLLMGSTGANPALGTITAGAGISVTNGAASITIASTGIGSLVWNDVSGTTQAAAANNGYIISNASQTTVTLPATAAEGSVFGVQGKGAAGWILQMNTGQVCHFGSSATTSAGSLTSTNQWDSVQIVCVTANTTFAVTSVIGNLTVA